MSDFEEFERKLGVLVEHMNDQFERVLEAVDSKTAAIPEIQKKLEKLDHISDDVEMIKADVKMQSLKVDSVQHNVKMLKLRSDKEQERLENRVTKLEAA
jgi:hypothetical protein